MFLDARSLLPQAVIDADVCIAGAGAAGITLARALLDRGLRVAVLESGDLAPAPATQDLYRGSNDGRTYSLADTRLRYFGGSTNHWSGWCRPLEPEDFTARSWLPASGWPVTADELAPYYHRARTVCEIAPLDFDALRLASLRGSPLLPLEPSRVQSIVYLYSPPTRFGIRYRDDLASAAGTTTYLNANLVNIQLAPGGAVQAFECATLSGVKFRVVASYFVLALGGAENARMLLASNSQVPAGIGNANDLVGRFFMEHPQTATSRTALLVASGDVDWSLYTTTSLVDGVACNAALQIAPLLRAAEGLAGMGITLRNAGEGSAGGLTAGEIGGLLRSSRPAHALSVEIRAEQRPMAENRLTLSTARDVLGIPRLQLSWSLTDVDDMRRSLELFGREVGRSGLGRLWLPRSFDSELEGAAHHMGTTRMGASPTDGVVDGDCRVYGIDNLFVAGSSVFTTGGYANPTLTIVALALRLADYLGALP